MDSEDVHSLGDLRKIGIVINGRRPDLSREFQTYVGLDETLQKVMVGNLAHTNLTFATPAECYEDENGGVFYLDWRVELKFLFPSPFTLSLGLDRTVRLGTKGSRVRTANTWRYSYLGESAASRLDEKVRASLHSAMCTFVWAFEKAPR